MIKPWIEAFVFWSIQVMLSLTRGAWKCKSSGGFSAFHEYVSGIRRVKEMLPKPVWPANTERLICILNIKPLLMLPWRKQQTCVLTPAWKALVEINFWVRACMCVHVCIRLTLSLAQHIQEVFEEHLNWKAFFAGNASSIQKAKSDTRGHTAPLPCCSWENHF